LYGTRAGPVNVRELRTAKEPTGRAVIDCSASLTTMGHSRLS
jgi:hypothetical protein